MPTGKSRGVPPPAVESTADFAHCDDPALVDLAGKGSEAAVRALVQRHNRRLYRIARAVVRDDAEAEDVVQETYLRAFTNLGSYRGEAAFSTWLTRITLNEALGRLRRRHPSVDIGTIASEGEPYGANLIMFPLSRSSPTPEAETARRQVRDILEQAVDQLPERFRIVFVLREIEQMSTEDAAVSLAIKPETVKTRLHRARRMIRAALNKQLSLAFSELFPFDGPRCERIADQVIRRLRGSPPFAT